MKRMPAFFVAHGAPSLAIEHDDATRAMRSFGEALDGAAAIAIVSAHWQTRGRARVNAVARPEMIYDFGGFDRALYSVRYEAPGEPELAREIAHLIGAELETERGWDHGVWVPLLHVRPQADLPVVEISLPMPSHDLPRIGRALGSLRDRGVTIAGSGGIVHNLRRLDFGNKDAPPADWAREFDAWTAERIEARDFAALEQYANAPNARDAVPTPEHFEPLLVVTGAAREDDTVRTIHAGFHYATLSMRSVAFV
jgi:4,5-DOPA dioxygenase extradiol